MTMIKTRHPWRHLRHRCRLCVLRMLAQHRHFAFGRRGAYRVSVVAAIRNAPPTTHRVRFRFDNGDRKTIRACESCAQMEVLNTPPSQFRDVRAYRYRTVTS